jgi:diphthamide synthase subunit DPH2
MGDLPSPKPNKTAWPELVGSPYFRAGLIICFERRDVTVVFVVVGDTPPPGFDPKRVVVFVDADQRVAFTPTIG